MLRYGHRPGTAAPVASTLDKSPHPKIMTSEDRNDPLTPVPALAADIYASKDNSATVTPPSPPQSPTPIQRPNKLWDDDDGPSYSRPSPPATNSRYLRRNHSRTKRALRMIPPVPHGTNKLGTTSHTSYPPTPSLTVLKNWEQFKPICNFKGRRWRHQMTYLMI